MHRAAAWILLFVSLALLPAPPAAAAAVPGPAPVLAGKAAVLMDAQTGQVLYEVNGGSRIYPASTTKILTALIAAESGRLAEVVTAGSDASGVEGTSCYLQVAEQHTLEDLSACLMVASGNDAAVAIADHLSGSVEAFATLMTQRALQAGATHSSFTNPHGLHDPNHYTTALDLARIGRAALNHPGVFRWGAMRKAFLHGPEKLREFINHNVLIFDIPGSSGKIGFTEEAGHTIVQLAEKDGKRLIAVLAGYEHKGWMFQHAEDLLNWGFATFQVKPVVAAGQVVQSLPVSGGAAPLVEVVAASAAEILVPAAGGEPSPPVRPQLRLPEHLNAPVAAGQSLGELVLMQSDQVLARIPLNARVDVPARSLPRIITQAGIRAGRPLLVTGLSLGLLVMGIRAFNRFRRRRRRQRRSQLAAYKRTSRQC